jgi:hypothetical protein|tara:strand:- start:193 stop:519 length:327 start_codon:yes stop_codon:yes gene_type:complete
MAEITLPLTEHQSKVVENWRVMVTKKLQRANGGAKAKPPTEQQILVELSNQMVYGAVVSRKLETQIIVAKRKSRNAPLTDLLDGLKIVGKKRGSYKKKENKTNKTESV